MCYLVLRSTVTFDKKVFHMYPNPPTMWLFVCVLAFLASGKKLLYLEEDTFLYKNNNLKEIRLPTQGYRLKTKYY